MESNRIKYSKERLCHSLWSAIQCFREADDRQGLHTFHLFLEEVESFCGIDRNSIEFQNNQHRLMKDLSKILEAMKNNDLVDMVDIMEYSLYPFLLQIYDGSAAS